MAIKTNTELVAKVKEIATKYKTLYVYGSFGSPVTSTLLAQKAKQYPSFYTDAKKKQLAQYVGKGYFGFDCVNLIKGILWGWNGSNATYGGAKYATNGVPDINADGMIAKCSGVTTNFSKIEVGEAVWCSGHIGIYIGDGLAVECTPRWSNNVQITAVGNIGKKNGYNTRTWTKHGKLPYIKYETKASTTVKPKLSIEEVAKLVLNGEYGNGAERTKKLKAEGYDPTEVQEKVNELLKTPKKSITKGAKVKVNKGAKSYEGKFVSSFIYDNVYVVDEIKDQRAVLDKKGICTAFNVKDLTIQ